MAKKKYPELEETQKFAEAMGAEVEVRFSKTDTPGIFHADVTVGGISPVGPMYFSFDKKRIFNFWSDYPDKLTAEQIQLFNKYNPTLAALKGFGGFPPNDPKTDCPCKNKKILPEFPTRTLRRVQLIFSDRIFL